MFTVKEITDINEISAIIFQATNIDELCNGVLDIMPEIVFHQKSFFTFRNKAHDGDKDVFRSLSLDDTDIDRYINHFSKLDYTAWFVKQGCSRVYRDSDIVSQKVMETADIYREWLIPMGMKYCCGNIIMNDLVKFGDLTLMRDEQYGDFCDKELFLLDLITQQIQRWFEIHYPNGYNDAVDGSNNSSPFSALLTERELTIAELIRKGMGTKEISEKLVIAYSTTRKHIANIFEKLEVTTRVQLINKLYKGQEPFL